MVVFAAGPVNVSGRAVIMVVCVVVRALVVAVIMIVALIMTAAGAMDVGVRVD